MEHQDIREIPFRETFGIRHRVLRPDISQSSAWLVGDTHHDTLHLGVYQNEQLVGVVSFMPHANHNFEATVQFQLMGMAIVASSRNKGLGERLLRHGEKLLQQQYKKLLIWLNAREKAIEFYKKYGYLTLGRSIDLPNVGKSILMYKFII